MENFSPGWKLQPGVQGWTTSRFYEKFNLGRKLSTYSDPANSRKAVKFFKKLRYVLREKTQKAVPTYEQWLQQQFVQSAILPSFKFSILLCEVYQAQ